MIVTELLSEIENLSREGKTETFNYLLKALGVDGDYLVGCTHNLELMVNAASQLMEFLKHEKASV
jgi:hypothetical protein